MRSIVSILRCEDYSPERVRAAVGQALDLAELSLAGERSVLLKPNLLSARRPEAAVTTHPAVVQALGEIVQAGGGRVSLGDSPPFAGENQQRYAKLCEQTGVAEVARHLGIPIVRFEEDVVTTPHPSGRFFHSFELARTAVDAELVVNIPKLKTHGLTAFTGAVKNVFGCVPGIRKGLFHVQAGRDREAFAQMLVDLLGALTPRVNVMDAVVAMEGDGPNAGTPRQIGLIVASSDPVALDAVACAVVGIDPMSIATTRLAHEQGLGCGDLADIEVRGECIQDVAVHGFKASMGKTDGDRIPAPVMRVLRRQFTASPMVGARECEGCGDCARVCPVSAIAAGKPAKIDLDKCIRCYCCHEVCNFSAIELRRGWIGEIVLGLWKKK